jgi:hypothetical protein
MKYFKIRVGYGDQEYVSIDETELESALAVFMTDSKGIFKNGVVRGKDIIGITEDWHRVMGWNPGHKLQPEDHAELVRSGVKREYAGLIEAAKLKVQYKLGGGSDRLLGGDNPLTLR